MVSAPLLVVGMHRSGTSFVAALLQAAGLDVGERLMPAARGNERGHFENMDFVEFHMHWLRMTGHDDAGWAAMDQIVLPEEALAEAKALIESNSRATPWGWKDPRTTLFLDLWSTIVPDAKYVFVYREPSEVIDSLFRRGDESMHLSPELASRAYISHNDSMLRHARLHRARSLITNVSAIARDPERFLAQVAQKLDVSLDVHAPTVFESELMHAIGPDAPRAKLLRHLVPEIDRLYAALEQEADLPSSTARSKRGSSSKTKDAYFKIWEMETRREADLEQRTAELAQKAEELERLRSAVEALDAERGAYSEDARLQLAYEGTMNERLEQALANIKAQLESAESANCDLKLQLESAKQRGEELAAQLESLNTRDRDLEAKLDDARTERQDLERRLEQTTRKFIAQTEALVATTRAETEKFSLLIDAVQSSRFWKFKRGIGRVLRSLHLVPR